MEDSLSEIVQEMLRLLASPALATGAPLGPEVREIELQARRLIEHVRRRKAALQYARMTCCGSVCLRPVGCKAMAGDPLATTRAASRLMIAGSINIGLEQAATIADRYLMDTHGLGSGALFMGAHTAATQISVSIRDLKQVYSRNVSSLRPP